MKRTGLMLCVVAWCSLLVLRAVAQNEPVMPDEDIVVTASVTPEPTEVLTPDDVTPPMPAVSEGSDDIINILLLGSDTTTSGAGRTDVIIVVSINRTQSTVSMLSIPRDLYVYIPGYRIYRINTAFSYGEYEVGEGQGYVSLRETIRYNLGLQIDYYARINFTAFRQIIDDLGGLEISVDCTIQDWRLIDPSLDETVEENWELFTLPTGVYTVDGDLALWYARSRRTSSDLDRGRRQQVILRALLTRIRELGLADQLRAVWPQLLEIVDTDLPLDVLLGLVPLSASLDSSRIGSYTLRVNQEVTPWRSPDGSSVLAPDRDAIQAMMNQFMLPPTMSRIAAQGPHLEIVNATGYTDMGRVAADRLAWEGFTVSLGDAAPYQEFSSITDLTGQSKGSSVAFLQDILRIDDEQIQVEPDAGRTADYRVVIGGDYQPCTYNVIQPQS